MAKRMTSSVDSSSELSLTRTFSDITSPEDAGSLDEQNAEIVEPYLYEPSDRDLSDTESGDGDSKGREDTQTGAP